MNYLLRYFFIVLLASCKQGHITPDKLKGHWELIETIGEDYSETKTQWREKYFLSIGKDRFYQYYTFSRIDYDQLPDSIPIDTNNLPLISDTNYTCYDYYLLGDQITLRETMYLPRKHIHHTSRMNIIYSDENLLKITSGQQRVAKIKILNDSTLILAYDSTDTDYVYRKIDSNDNNSTQEDIKRHMKKLITEPPTR